MKNSNANKRVLVTGANSLLGTNTIIELLDHGYSVRGMLRRRNSWLGPEHPNLELFEGEITRQTHLNAALQSCNFVVHTAAVTSQNLLRYEEYAEVNVEVVEKLARACAEHGCEAMLWVGSANVFGHGSRLSPADETAPPRHPFDKSLYAQSKIQARQVFNEVSRQFPHVRYLSVHPGFMLGPWDSKPSSGEIILMYQKYPVVFCPPGGKSFVHVRDVARGICLALEKGTSGNEWLFADENLSYRTFFQKLNRITGRRKPILVIPRWLLIFTGHLGDAFRAVGVATELSSVNMKILCEDPAYSSARAKAQLGISFSSVDKAIKEALQWFSANKPKKG